MIRMIQKNRADIERHRLYLFLILRIRQRKNQIFSRMAALAAFLLV